MSAAENYEPGVEQVRCPVYGLPGVSLDTGRSPYLYAAHEPKEIREEGWAMRLHEHPEIRFVSQRAEQLARDILEQKARLLHGAPEEAETVDRPTDAIGNHRRVLKLWAQNADREVIAKAEREAYYDSMYGFGEKMQKLDSDLPKARWFDIDEQTGTICAGNVPLRENYAKALTPLTTPVETDRRRKEFCNVAVMEQLPRLGLDKHNNFAFVSLIPADEDTIKKSYVPEIKKMMINFISFHDTGDGKKMRLQIGAIPGTEIDLDDINHLYTDMGLIEPGEKLDETEILGLVVPLPKTHFTDVVDFIKLLDNHDEHELFMGWKVPEDHSKDYYGEHSRCAEKYEKFAAQMRLLNEYAYDLARLGVRPEEAQGLIDAKQKQLAIEICQTNPSQARVTFDEKSEKAFQKIVDLRSVGESEQADEHQAELIVNLPDLEGCGGGACDLYREATASEAIVARSIGLRVGWNESVSFNGYAKCGGCGRRGLYQAGIGRSASFVCPVCRGKKYGSGKNRGSKSNWPIKLFGVSKPVAKNKNKYATKNGKRRKVIRERLRTKGRLAMRQQRVGNR